MAKSDFRVRVLQIVSHIPRGTVLTYKQVAHRAGNPRAARAVGAILRMNYATHIPCHRVIRSNGTLGGYNKGTQRKKQLLRKEGVL